MSGIGDDVEHDDRRRREHQQRHQDGVVAAGERLGEEAAEPRPGKYTFGDNSAGDEQRGVHHDDRQHRPHRIAKRVANDDVASGNAARARRQHERLGQRLDHRPPQIPRPARCLHDGQHRDRHHQVLHVIDEVAAAERPCDPTTAASGG